MNDSQSIIQESNTVGVKLMAGEEAEAVAAVIGRTCPDAEIEHYPSYISIERPQRLDIDLPPIAEELGRPYDAPTFLVILSSYNGRISVEDERITLTTEVV
uniref:Ethene monooxygenase coupling/effector protein n=1 Tax=uncultured bacterium UPO45 TaxID=1776970 RepID=A0A126SY16_9BACT|nr:ethene monooxygenase coupling/effector protein [uncultured bacterium UPO45]